LRAGFGIGICQTGIARRDPDLLPVLAKQFKVEMEVWIVMHNDLKRISRMRLMFDHLSVSLAQYALAAA
jgi:DNA-binding transcriptional LysR family regulator